MGSRKALGEALGCSTHHEEREAHEDIWSAVASAARHRFRRFAGSRWSVRG
tara:strand:- start:972 stop:1124 length:153 start_codon:yes stop_codon:yes gene_type:complete